MGEPIKDIAIIGAGPSGLFAAFQAGLLGLDVAVFDSLPEAGGQLAALYPEKEILDVPGFLNIEAGDLSQKLYEQAQSFHPEFYFDCQIHSIEKKENIWHLRTSQDQTFQARSIIVAAGGGSFQPKRPTHIENLEIYEATSVFYHVQDSKQFEGKNITIIGGGDSAVDWAMQLTEEGSYVTLVHRRDKFRALPAHVEKIRKFAEEGRLNLKTSWQLKDLQGENRQLNHVRLHNMDQDIIEVPTDYLLIFMGLDKDLGPIQQWGLSESKTRIEVNPITMQTIEEGIFAIGDIAHWEEKIPLIVTGFGEAAIAVRQAFMVARPEEKLKKIHSTSMQIP